MAWGNILSSGSSKEFSIDGHRIRAVYHPAGNKKPSRLTMNVLGDFQAQAVFRRENALDRMGKTIGLTCEVQLNDPQSDDLVYFECDDEDFVRRLFREEDTRAAARQLLKDFDAVELFPRSCAVTKTGSRDWIREDPDRVAMAGEALVRIVKAMPQASSGQKSVTPLTDEYQASSRLFLVVSGCLLIASVIALIWAVPVFQPVTPGKVWGMSLKWSLPALFLFMWYAVPRLKGHAQSMRSVLQVLAMSLAGFLIGGFGLMTVLNGCLDASRPQQQDVRVVDKHISRSKNSTTYYVRVSSWKPDMASYQIKVSRREYDQAVVDQPYAVMTRQGAFGFEWISGHFSGRGARQDKQF